MSEISKIKAPDGEVYTIKDTTSRNQKPFHIWVSANSATSYTITNSKITANHRVITETIVRSTADIIWTTAAGTCTLSCTAGIPAMGLCFYLP